MVNEKARCVWVYMCACACMCVCVRVCAWGGSGVRWRAAAEMVQQLGALALAEDPGSTPPIHLDTLVADDPMPSSNL